MKKGFTLIELLAVIVILAIIALIATPIILGIINDARKEINERSAELYASAVRNAIVSYQLIHPNVPTKFTDLDVQYDGKIECATEELYTDGSFYITDCTVNGTKVDYTYGTKQASQVYKPQYYTFDLGFYGSVFAENTDIMRDAFKDVIGDTCTFSNDNSECSADGLFVGAATTGYVYARNDYDSDEYVYCGVSAENFRCRD